MLHNIGTVSRTTCSQHQVSGINCIFPVNPLVSVLRSTRSFAPCSEPWSPSAQSCVQDGCRLSNAKFFPWAGIHPCPHGVRWGTEAGCRAETGLPMKSWETSVQLHFQAFSYHWATHYLEACRWKLILHQFWKQEFQNIPSPPHLQEEDAAFVCTHLCTNPRSWFRSVGVNVVSLGAL